MIDRYYFRSFLLIKKDIYFKNIPDFFFIFTGSPFGSQIGRLWPQSYLHCGTSRCQSNSNLSCCQNTKILQHQNPKSSPSQGMQKKLYYYFFPQIKCKIATSKQNSQFFFYLKSKSLVSFHFSVASR